MDEHIKISVIVPVYGVEKYIGKCVRSLMTQTLDGLEYIFVDDCTPDSSVAIANEIIAQYPQRARLVKWVHHPQNKGLPAARNSGLALATGEYIYHCDSDDYLHPHMLEKLYTKARNEHLDFVWCDFYKETETALIHKHTFLEQDNRIDMMISFLTCGWNVVWMGICRNSVYKINGIKSMETISFCEDMELVTRLLTCSKSYGKVCEPLYYYNRLNESSIVSKSLCSKNLMSTTNDGIIALDSIYRFIKEQDPKLFEQIKTILHWNILNAKKFLCFYPSQRNRYLAIYPECHKDIDSNPLCSRKYKILQHLILSPITAPIAWLIGLVFKLKHN